MLIEVTDRHRELATEFRQFAEEHVAPRASQADREERLAPSLVDQLREAGYLGSQLAPGVGGRGLDRVAYGFLHEELGRACSSTRSLLTVHDMVAEAVSRLGSRSVREAWLPRLATGHTIAAFALTEPEAGSDAASVQTTATSRANGYVLTGRKRWISFAQLADVLFVVARIDAGPLAGFLVPRDAPGLTLAPMSGLLGLRASMLAEIELDGVVVPDEARVGAVGMPDGLLLATALQLGRYSVAWGCVGIGEACVEASFRHSREREQFGVPIAAHQLIRRRLTEMVVSVRAARLLCLEAGSAAERRVPEAVEATLVAKYFASQAAVRCTEHAVQIHGGSGCSDALPIERYFRDARMMEVIEGTTEILQLLIPGGRLAAGAADDAGAHP